MARLPYPCYCLHKPTDQAFCTIRVAGRRVARYLGVFGSMGSFVRYEEVLREVGISGDHISQAVDVARLLVRSGSGPLRNARTPVTVQALYNAFQKWAPTHYRLPSGDVSREVDNFRDSFREMLDLFGATPVAHLSRSDLVSVRQRMIDRKLSRKVINQRVGRIVRVFVWGGDEDRKLVPDSVAAAFRLVSPLKPFRSLAKETEPVGPVPVADLQKVLAVAHPVLKAMLTLQLLTGCRPGEVRLLQKKMVQEVDGACVLDFGLHHKMAYKGRKRVVPIGPQARELLQEWLAKSEPDQHLFRPEFSPKSAGRKRRSFYSSAAYTLSVRYACQKAGVPPFGPNRVRHRAATDIRKLFDLDAAQAVLGHSSRTTTERYASPVNDLAKKVAEERG